MPPVGGLPHREDRAEKSHRWAVRRWKGASSEMGTSGFGSQHLTKRLVPFLSWTELDRSGSEKRLWEISMCFNVKWEALARCLRQSDASPSVPAWHGRLAHS